jgi:predicted transcriptional regulator of viral defense system
VTDYSKGIITPREVRRYADMGDTNSEIVLTSNLLKKWVQEGKVERVRKGTYRIIKRREEIPSLSRLLELLKERKL